MFNRFRNWSIENKLFGVFALTTIVAALSVLTSIAMLLAMQGIIEDMGEIYESAQSTFQAKSYLQEMERLEKTAILNFSIEDADTFLIYVALFENYYRQAILEASDPNVINALYEIDRSKITYVETVKGITQAALPQGSVANLDNLIDKATSEMGNLNEQIEIISQHSWNAFDQAQSRQKLFQAFAAIFNIFALIDFLTTAAIAITVIRRGVFAPAALLSDAAQAVGDNDFSPDMLDPLIEGSDEMGELARAFVQMADTLKTRERELQTQIDKVRTRLISYE